MKFHTSVDKMMKMTCTMMCMCCGLYYAGGEKDMNLL